MAAAGPISVFEAYDRFQNGRKVREDTWNHTIVPNNAAALKDKYRLNFGKSIIPEDRDICDRLFEAGVEMLVMTGFFNPDISKVMNVTESEVFEGLKKATPRLRLGSGRDEVICARRRGNSSIRPIIQGGPTGTQVSEDMIVTMMQAYAQEALVDSLAGGVLATSDGHVPAANTPWEIRAAVAEIRAMREGMHRASRPGMPIKGPDTPLSPAARFASCNGGLMKNDMHMCSQLNEMKMDMAGLNLLAGWSVNGDTIVIEQMPMFGGYCGGIEETAICDVAATLATAAIFDGDIHTDGPVHMGWGVTTARETLQIAAHASAAVDANCDMLLANQYYLAAGPCTDICLFEAAAQAICDTASGREMITGAASAKGIARDRVTPMETRMMGEAAEAAAGMKVSEVNEILEKLIPMYGPYAPQPPKGKRFQDCYDMRTVTPTEEYLGIYDGVLRALNEMGLNIKY